MANYPPYLSTKQLFSLFRSYLACLLMLIWAPGNIFAKDQAPLNGPITLGAITDQSDELGDTPTLTLAASGGLIGESFTFTASGLPTGLSIGALTGVISGTLSVNPADAGIYPVTVTASKPSSAPVSVSFTWTLIDPAVGIWTNITNVSEHIPRHENSMVQAGDKFYLFGGREDAIRMNIYDYQTNSWTLAASNAPHYFNHFQAIAYDGLIWVIGAFMDNDFPNELPADHVYMYDPVGDVWIQGPAVPVGRKRGAAGVVVYGDKFYVVAGSNDGHDGGYIPWFDEFDPQTGTWTSLADAPHARDHFHATVVGDKLYVAGGRETGGGVDNDLFAPVIPEVDVYDFITQTWSTLPASSNLPAPRAAGATITFNGKVVLMGGEAPDSTAALKNVDALDVTTGTWSSLADMNHARHGTQAIVSGDGIWISSGSPALGYGHQTNMELFGTDNPAGTPVSPGVLTSPGSTSIPVGATESITLSNSSGNQGLIIRSLSLSGANSGSFSILSGPTENFLIPAGTSISIPIQHTGSIVGEEASLDISYHNSASTSVSLNATSSFPVELLAFDAYVVNSQTSLLRWATASEFENAYFEVEKSSNQQDFEVIGQVQGAGTTLEIQSYSLMDHTPMYPTNYYRLRQVDFDGATTTSGIIELSAKDVLQQLSVYPNPAQGSMWISLVVENPALEYRMVIRDIQGRVLDQQYLSVDELGERYHIDLSSFTEGLYSIELLSNDGEKYSTQFIKSRR